MKNLKPNFKLWLTDENNQYVIGEGGAKLLQIISEINDLSKAKDILKISYRKAWNLIQKINSIMNEPIVESFRGGRGGGGGMRLTETGKSLLDNYYKIYEEMKKIVLNAAE
ncbi:MAG: winged helix-turn-helix domain-containing protein [Promethearchaeota archaeon]